MEREQERSAQKTHSAQKAMDDARESVASHLVTVGSMFTMFDEEHEGFLHRKGFTEAMVALGSDRQAASDIFDELDVYSRDKIHYGAYLECALRMACRVLRSASCSCAGKLIKKARSLDW